MKLFEILSKVWLWVLIKILLIKSGQSIFKKCKITIVTEDNWNDLNKLEYGMIKAKEEAERTGVKYNLYQVLDKIEGINDFSRLFIDIPDENKLNELLNFIGNYSVAYSFYIDDGSFTIDEAFEKLQLNKLREKYAKL